MFFCSKHLRLSIRTGIMSNELYMPILTNCFVNKCKTFFPCRIIHLKACCFNEQVDPATGIKKNVSTSQKKKIKATEHQNRQSQIKPKSYSKSKVSKENLDLSQKQFVEQNHENMNVQETSLPITTKHKTRRKIIGSNIDHDMVSLIQKVVDELKIKPEDKNISKKKLSNRFQVIVDHKLSDTTTDFESMLKDIQASKDKGATAITQKQKSTAATFVEGEPSSIKIDLTSGRRFGIFEKGDYTEEKILDQDQSKWSALDWFRHYKKNNDSKIIKNLDKRFAISAYDELISLTEQGKLWNFPINNEDGMTEEAKVPFYEHVFLEDKLNEGDWCPKNGALRDFMTCIINALSQNSYLTVKEKHEHIEWFRDYFTERMETLKRLDLMSE